MQYLKWSSKNILESRTGHANRAFFIIGLKQGLAKYGQGVKSSPPPTFFSNVVLLLYIFLSAFIFGSAGSLMHRLSPVAASGATLHCRARASHCGGLSC